MTALGLDTSNYTTSCALYDSETRGVVQQKKLLPVKPGELGLRQSDAVFHHVQQLPGLLGDLLTDRPRIDVIGVSVRPRPVEGSYMPCCEAGRSSAAQLGAVLGCPVYAFSHQEGHIAAALHSVGRFDSMPRPFIAFHLSGGTTEAVRVADSDSGFDIEYLCGSLDLKAGQAVDRVASMLGMSFPGGAQLDKLALTCDEKIKCRPTMKGRDCCLSGVENQCRELVAAGREPAYVARYCLNMVSETVAAMCAALLEEYGDMPVLIAGGVAASAVMRGVLSERFDVVFATPELSGDNAVGIALLSSRAEG